MDMCSETIARALERATDTKACLIGDGALDETARLFRDFFPGAGRALVVDDPRTRAAAGVRVADLLRAQGVEVVEHVLEPGGKIFHGDYRYAEEVRAAIQAAGVERGGKKIVPVAVGSGVVNDVTKRASGELGLAYLTVGTAASVDGYSSFGAALRSPEGAKQTYPCPAPRVIIADLDVMRTAPAWMAASAQMADYAAAYAAMPPEEAAAIFDTMGNSLELVGEILWSMTSAQRGAILARMNEDIAAQVTRIMDPQ